MFPNIELGDAVVSVFDRSGREDVRLHQPNAFVVDLQGYVDHTLPSLLCITMIFRVRRIFFLKLLHSSTVEIAPSNLTGSGDRPQGSLSGITTSCIVRGHEDITVALVASWGALCLHTAPNGD